MALGVDSSGWMPSSQSGQTSSHKQDDQTRILASYHNACPYRWEGLPSSYTWKNWMKLLHAWQLIEKRDSRNRKSNLHPRVEVANTPPGAWYTVF